jgi:hypothetical protein
MPVEVPQARHCLKAGTALVKIRWRISLEAPGLRIGPRAIALSRGECRSLGKSDSQQG